MAHIGFILVVEYKEREPGECPRSFARASPPPTSDSDSDRTWTVYVYCVSAFTFSWV